MCLNHPETILHPQFMGKLSSVKLVPGAEKAGGHCCGALRLADTLRAALACHAVSAPSSCVLPEHFHFIFLTPAVHFKEHSL